MLSGLVGTTAIFPGRPEEWYSRASSRFIERGKMPPAPPKCHSDAGLRTLTRLHFIGHELRSPRPHSSIATLVAGDLFPGNRSVGSDLCAADGRAIRRRRPAACRGGWHEHAPCAQRRGLCRVRSARSTSDGQPFRPVPDRISSGGTSRTFSAKRESRVPEGVQVQVEAPGPAVQTGVALFLRNRRSQVSGPSAGRNDFGE